MSLICHLVNRADNLSRMKDGDKDYKSMLPCYYVEKIDELRGCLAIFRLKKRYIKKRIGVSACSIAVTLYFRFVEILLEYMGGYVVYYKK